MFFFYFSRNSACPVRRIDPQAVIRRLTPYSVPDKSGFMTDDENSLMIQCVHWNTARSRLEPSPFYHAGSKTAAASWARLDNRDELGTKLGIDPKAMGGCCDTELILLSYLKWQESCVDHLVGDFAFVVHDRRNQKVFCGRDHMGARPFYYFASDDVFVCAASAGAMLGLECAPIEIDAQWVAEYLTHLSMSFDRTAYKGIKKLPPAHCLIITPQQMQLRQYFELSSEPALRLKDSREYVDAYREQLETTIQCRLDSDYAVGSELSGGIDSSTITAYAAKFLAPKLSRLHAFSFAFSELEPQYIQAVIDDCRLPHCHIFNERDQNHQDAMQRSLNIIGYPAEHGNATFHEPFYQLAEKLKIRTLLSGFGGDEFSTTLHGNLAPMEMLLKRRYWALFNILPGNAFFRFLRLIKMELRRRATDNFKMPACNPRFYKAFKERWPHQIVRDELVRRYNLEKRYFDSARFDGGYTDLKRFTLERRWQPFVPTRMENCSLMAAGRKIEYRWPLLDVRLVHLFLTIPSEENYYRGLSRYLHRRAIDGTVPAMAVWKPGKDMGAILGQNHRRTEPLHQFSVSDLHPALAECIDTEKLGCQIAQLPAMMDSDMRNNKKMQFIRNIGVAMDLCAWMKLIEMELASNIVFQ